MSATPPAERQQPLSGISIKGFKSLRDETSLEIRPLTILSGANSAGKSSAIQPLLLLKQTLEVGYDPGPLLLSGPNVRFTAMDQLLWHGKRTEDRAPAFEVELRNGSSTVRLSFRSGAEGAALDHMAYGTSQRLHLLREDMTEDEILALPPPTLPIPDDPARKPHFTVRRRRCMLALLASWHPFRPETEAQPRFEFAPSYVFQEGISSLIHLPGLRGNPERAYPTTQVGSHFPGTFQQYVASVIAAWAAAEDDRLRRLGNDLRCLGLTWKVETKRLDDTQVELRVGRLPSSQVGGAKDLVNIADVGFGVTQALPVVVALLAAEPGQLVYLEQPEIHLHPRAQVSLAQLLLEAARRGVLVLAETHSQLLLRAIQEQVASGAADASLVKLHWFQRDDQDGATRVTSADLDHAGTFGDWPEDFADVEMDLESRFLSASLGNGKK